MFVNITNGVNTFNVSEGAYTSIFKNQGYTIVEDEEKEIESNDEEMKADETDDFEELLEKPISQWTKQEIKDFASANGIDISGTKSATEAKEIIKQFLEM